MFNSIKGIANRLKKLEDQALEQMQNIISRASDGELKRLVNLYKTNEPEALKYYEILFEKYR